MNVNSVLGPIMKSKLVALGGLLLTCIAIFLTASAFVSPTERDLFVKRVNLAIREIGHHLLLLSGDSTSQILPVKEKSEGVFVLEFENEFAFKPDSLVAFTQRSLAKTGLTDYTVTVYKCFKPDIVYGFMIAPPNNSIQPCLGRSQAKDCYTIEIAFYNFNATTDTNHASTKLILGGFLLLFGVTLIVKRFRRYSPDQQTEDDQQPLAVNTKATLPAIGKLLFDQVNQKLISSNEVITLTDKECKVLELLNQNFGELTSRDVLIQQVWANEGVITGRSLDMFISKLRKKISIDPDLRITNIHGKGYKLEVAKG